MIDVRTKQEWDTGFIDGAIHIPLKNLSNNIGKYTENNNEEILLYCRSGNRSGKAKLILEELGYTNIKNIGGIEDVSKNLDLKIIIKEFHFGSVDDHLNLVFSSSSKDYVEQFYGELIGLKRISDIHLPGNRLMIRYIGGESELKFIVNEDNKSLIKEKPDKFYGISKLTLYFPIQHKKALIEKLEKNKIKFNNFREFFINNINFTSFEILDFEKNLIEIIFIEKEIENYKYNYSKISVNVSSRQEANRYFGDVLGFKAIKNEQGLYDFKMGKTIIGINEIDNFEINYVGMPHEILGMSLIQFVVQNIPLSRDEIIARGGEIYIEPYNIGDLAIIMFTKGPNGILFEFGAAL
tara:strand:+ start:1678 stop:2733 length:1056 start_codon:yes stop_codon:yes gene_type:complete